MRANLECRHESGKDEVNVEESISRTVAKD